ncbi:MAG: EAL domain-containing protein [Lachnospiraceae bacterium]|nr:EAL domain-containing protein [Lachnospiraceae bacterium]
MDSYQALEKRIRKTDPKKDFVLYYQPRYDEEAGELSGVEVFPRLREGSQYDISADKLVQIAENTGVMNRLGIWIAEEAISSLADWNRTSGKKYTMSINLSTRQIMDSRLLDSLKEITESRGVEPELVNLDVQNEVLMGVEPGAKDVLMSLHEYGYSLSLNNFGGDVINLSYILECGFCDIHVSRTLIERAGKDLDAQTLIRAIVAIGREMSIEVSAVGIETDAQAELIRSLGIRKMQGYFFGRPVDKEVFESKYII